MQHSLAAIRAGLPPTRFTVPASRRRLPRLGLTRQIFAAAARRAPIAGGGLRDELRRATRSCVTTPRRQPSSLSAQRRLRAHRGEVRWGHRVEGSLRHARPRSAAPWRA